MAKEANPGMTRADFCFRQDSPTEEGMESAKQHRAEGAAGRLLRSHRKDDGKGGGGQSGASSCEGGRPRRCFDWMNTYSWYTVLLLGCYGS